MIWPLYKEKPNVPMDGSVGSFGFKRSYYYHPGIDLYCEFAQDVLAIEDGVVVNVEVFTGVAANPSSPWWNRTWSVLIEGASGVLGYCELEHYPHIKKGFQIKEGEQIGRIIPVLKKDKGNGTTMLHFEKYKPGTKHHVTWHHDAEKPEELEDPTELLRSL